MNPEPEIQSEIFEYAASCGYGVSEPRKDHFFFTNNGKQRNGFNEKLRKLGIWEKKTIPACYLTAARDDRLELLAGLIDTDGTLDQRGKRVLSIVQKNEELANGLIYLARSLGIHASKRVITKKCCNTGAIGQYFHISLTRNIEIIPIRVPKKRPNSECRKQRSNLHFGIRSIELLGEGNYYGFEIDGDHKFLSGDFMVLHNTGKSFLLAWLLDWNMRVFPHSYAVLTATNIEQARSVVWKYLDGVIECMDGLYPWMARYFVKETRRYFARLFKDSWYVLPKTASKSAPENLAGQHKRQSIVLAYGMSEVEFKLGDLEQFIQAIEKAENKFNNRVQGVPYSALLRASRAIDK